MKKKPDVMRCNILYSNQIESFEQIDQYDDGTFTFLVHAMVREDRYAKPQLFPSTGHVKLCCDCLEAPAFQRLLEAYDEQEAAKKLGVVGGCYGYKETTPTCVNG